MKRSSTTSRQKVMNKFFMAIILFFPLFFLFKNSQAQVIKVGAGGEFRGRPPAGLMAKATYSFDFIDENLRSSADMMVLPELEGNLDIHYSFISNFGFNAYGIGGVNLASNFGANIGAGLMYSFTERIYGYWESKYIIKQDEPEASIKVGVLINL